MLPARRQRTALLLTGAMVLGSGAYALGSQAGGGNADASGSSAAAPACRPHDGRGEGFAGLASRLGVSPEKLRSALQALRQGRPAGADPRAAFAGALAGALGIPEAKVTAALDKLRPRHERHGWRRDRDRRGGHAAAKSDLAKALGVTANQLDAALAKVRAGAEKQFEARRDASAQALADKLGIPVQKVKDAFAAGPRGMGPGGRPGPPPRRGPGDGQHWG